MVILILEVVNENLCTFCIRSVQDCFQISVMCTSVFVSVICVFAHVDAGVLEARGYQWIP